MAEISQGGGYPKQEIKVVAFPEELSQLYRTPPGLLSWPPVQLRYLTAYVKALGCRTVVIESHYVDRDYIDDRNFPPAEGAGVIVFWAPDEQRLRSLLRKADRTLFRAEGAGPLPLEGRKLHWQADEPSR